MDEDLQKEAKEQAAKSGNLVVDLVKQMIDECDYLLGRSEKVVGSFGSEESEEYCQVGLGMGMGTEVFWRGDGVVSTDWAIWRGIYNLEGCMGGRLCWAVLVWSAAPGQERERGEIKGTRCRSLQGASSRR